MYCADCYFAHTFTCLGCQVLQHSLSPLSSIKALHQLRGIVDNQLLPIPVLLNCVGGHQVDKRPGRPSICLDIQG